MKLKNIFQLLGLRGKSKHYLYKNHSITLKNGFKINYAQWLHPRETKKTITDEMVASYQHIINEGDFCIDIGAHSGDSTLPMAIAVGKTGCVLALEPNPFVYHVLEKNARSNSQLVNIKTIMAAASTKEEFKQFEYSDNGYCNGGHHKDISVLKHGHPFKLEVLCVNITNELKNDYSLLLPKLSMIKVDTEGYDLYVLKTMHNIINEYKPIIKAEIYKKTNLKYRQELLHFLEKHHYSVFRISEEPITTKERITENNLTQWKHYDVLCLPEKMEHINS